MFVVSFILITASLETFETFCIVVNTLIEKSIYDDFMAPRLTLD